MSEKNIWNKLKSFGIPDTGVAAIMGNMYFESLLLSNNVENRCPLTDEAYTALVDANNGYDFETDNGKAYGYGLCQWTYRTRKKALLAFARERGVSISDEVMQCEYLWYELKSGSYPRTFRSIMNGNLYDATDAFCREFENPAVPNVQDRYSAANKYYNKYKGTSEQPVQTNPTTIAPVPTINATGWEHCPAYPRTICEGMVGKDVEILCAVLKARGYGVNYVTDKFGALHAQEVVKFQMDVFPNEPIEWDGIVGKKTWEKLLEIKQ